MKNFMTFALFIYPHIPTYEDYDFGNDSNIKKLFKQIKYKL